MPLFFALSVDGGDDDIGSAVELIIRFLPAPRSASRLACRTLHPTHRKSASTHVPMPTPSGGESYRRRPRTSSMISRPNKDDESPRLTIIICHLFAFENSNHGERRAAAHLLEEEKESRGGEEEWRSAGRSAG